MSGGGLSKEVQKQRQLNDGERQWSEEYEDRNLIELSEELLKDEFHAPSTENNFSSRIYLLLSVNDDRVIELREFIRERCRKKRFGDLFTSHLQCNWPLRSLRNQISLCYINTYSTIHLQEMACL